MTTVNIAEPVFEYDPVDPDGFKAGLFRLGNHLPVAASGASVYELPPGQAICPYHYEVGEEEWLLVLSGTPILRTPGGEETLKPWDMTCFLSGPGGAHAVRNDTAETLRVLMWSTTNSIDVTVYPDSGKVGVPKGSGDRWMLKISSDTDYYDGEVPSD